MTGWPFMNHAKTSVGIPLSQFIFGSVLFASGMAAATSLFLALRPGDHVVIPRIMYWALRSWLAGFATGWGLVVESVDASDVRALRAAIRPRLTRLVWLETPANPLWTISDIAAAAEAAHSAGALLAVDSTVATPVLTRPLALGADIVMHSATKYLNGHSDAIIGTLTAARTSEFWERIKIVQAQNGAIPGTFEAWLCNEACERCSRVCAGSARQPRWSRNGSRRTPPSPRFSIRGCQTSTGTKQRAVR
jgi:cystathionine beta-lyase/cystathionine gamma-synthase